MEASKSGGTKAKVAAAAGADRGSVEGPWEVSKRMRERLREVREERGARLSAVVDVMVWFLCFGMKDG